MKDLKINKELLSEVLNLKTTQEFNYHIEDNLIVISDFGEQLFEINIYEFAFKCKEWVRDNGYEIIVFEEKDKTFYCVLIPKYNIHNFSGLLTSVTTYSRWDYNEIQTAIFEACEWVLDNIKEIKGE